MYSTKILAAAAFAACAVTAHAQQYGPGGPGCAPGATPGAENCTGYGGRGVGMRERLKAADKNADGLISREEARTSLPRLYENFSAIDSNGDGQISFAELQAYRQAHHAAGTRGQGWRKWDANGDGKLSREEVANSPRLGANFDAIDTDHDGFLTAEELRAAHGRIFGRGRPG